MKAKIWYFIPSVLFTIIIGWLCLSPRVNNLGIRVNDKSAHIIAFMGLGMAYSLSFVRGLNSLKYKLGLLLGFLIAVFYGGLIEILQDRLIPGRYGDFYDWLADIVGALFGIFVSSLLFNTKNVPLFGKNI